LKGFTAINPEIHDDSAAFCARTFGLKGNGAEGGLFEKGDEREGFSAAGSGNPGNPMI
jgi:hypothetical protein